MALNQAIKLDGILSKIQNTEVQVYSTSSIANVNDLFDDSIKSTLAFEDVPSLTSQVSFGTSQLNFIIYANGIASTLEFGSEEEFIKLDATLLRVQNTQLSQYSTVPIELANDQLDDAIDSSLAFGTLQLNQSINLGSIESLSQVVSPQINQQIDDAPFPSIESLLEFGLPTLNFKIYTNSIESALEFGNSTFKLYATAGTIESTSTVSPVRLNQQIDDAPFPSIDSTLEFGNIKLSRFVTAGTIESTSEVGRPQVTRLIVAQTIAPTLQFGNTRLNQEIRDIPTPEIQSTVVVSTPNVLKVIGPLGISSTENFGVSAFIDNIHRLLVFKDDNISKVGENDAVVIAGGIRMNPSSVISDVAASGEAQLPAAPVGFLSVNINGVDYKVPYYNS